MTLFSEKEEKIFGDVMYDLLNSTNVSRSSPGSKMKALAQTVSKKMGRMWSQFDLNIGVAFLSGAEGKYLEFIGDLLGLPRLGEEPARVGSAERIIRFYVETGNFGDINGGSSILLDSGTIISTGVGCTGIRYRVSASTTLNLLDSEAFIPAQSVKAGSGTNVGSLTLNYHSFTGYVDITNSSLKVTNDADITTGEDLEIDSNYRFRLANRITSIEGGNEVSARLAALEVPGVADVVLIPFFRGIGTSEILVKAITPTITTGLIAAVSSSVNTVTSEGFVRTVRGPTELGLSMTSTLTPTRVLSPEETTETLENVTQNVSDYVNSLDIGEDFIINEVVETVLATSALIKNIGTAGRPLEKLFVYRPSRLEDNKVRSSLLTDLLGEADARIIVEPNYAGPTPILFRFSN